MILSLKLLAISCLGVIAYQDFKERQVLWFLFPIIALILALLHFLQTIDWRVLLFEIAINGILVTSIFSILFVYTKLISKKVFLGHSIGLGDILFFYAFALGFPTVSFVILLVGSIIFSVLIYFFLKSRMHSKSVPLAGLMGLFLIFVFGYSLILNNTLLYGL